MNLTTEHHRPALVARVAGLEVEVLAMRAELTAKEAMLRTFRECLARLDREAVKESGGGGAADGLHNGAGGAALPPPSPVPATRKSPSNEVEKMNTPAGYPAKLADASTLPALTPKQADVFATLVRMRVRRGWISLDAMEKASNVSGIGYHLDQLARKGYVKNYGQSGSPEWWPIAQGEPPIGRGGRGSSVPVSVTPDDDGVATLDDLSSTAKIVLVHIFDGGVVDAPTLSKLKGSDGRLDYPMLSVKRLAHLGCIRALPAGGYQCTDRGNELVKQFRAAQEMP